MHALSKISRHMPCKAITIGVALIVTLAAMVSCSASKPECSNPAITAKVKELFLEQLGQDYGLSVIYDLKNSEYELRSIRTSSSEPTRCVCQAELVLRLKLTKDLKAGLAPKSANATEQQMKDTLFREKEQVVALRYRAERTDDGKDTYVSIDSK